MIGQLDGAPFSERAKAAETLWLLSEFAAPVLRAQLNENTPTLEQRKRLSTLIVKIDDPRIPPACLPGLRAVEVLERVGSTEARRLINQLAQGHPGAKLTREARLALLRLNP